MFEAELNNIIKEPKITVSVLELLYERTQYACSTTLQDDIKSAIGQWMRLAQVIIQQTGCSIQH
jgi:hypothetical protein